MDRTPESLSVAILVPADFIARVIGKAGNGLKQIRECSGCRVLVQEAGSDRSATRRVDLCGSPLSIGMGVGSVLHVMSQGQGPIEAVLLIPNAATGAVIGKGGDNLRRLREATGVRIQVEREPVTNTTTGEQERMMNVSGDPASIGQGLGMALGASGPMSMMMASGGGGLPGGGMTPTPGLGMQPEVHAVNEDPEVIQVHVVIPGKLTGAIVGKEGATIKQLASQAGCKMSVTTRTASSDRRVICIGGYQQISIAQQLLDKQVQQASGEAGIDPNSVSTVTAIFWVPKEVSGAIIGKGGATLGHIREQCGVKVNFGKEEVKLQRPCSITGALNNVLQAEGMIFQLLVQERSTIKPPKRPAMLQDATDDEPKRPRMVEGTYDQMWQGPQNYEGPQNFDESGGWQNEEMGGQSPWQNGGCGEGHAAGGQAGGQPGGNGQTKMLIPSRCAGAVIGKQGSGLGRIRQECGVKLELLQQAQAPQWPEERLLTIQGSSECRLRAMQAVLQAAFQQDASQQAVLKLLVSQQDAGAIIGKQGFTLKQLREQTGVGCQVEKNEIYGERLVTASGHVSQVLSLAGCIMNLVK